MITKTKEKVKLHTHIIPFNRQYVPFQCKTNFHVIPYLMQNCQTNRIST